VLVVEAFREIADKHMPNSLLPPFQLVPFQDRERSSQQQIPPTTERLTPTGIHYLKTAANTLLEEDFRMK